MNAIVAAQPDLFAPSTLTLHEQIGFELGWDYAHHRLVPPAPYALEPSPVRDGLLAGQATFGLRTLQPTRQVRKWLQLRLHAWLRGRSVELTQVTPNYLKQIDTAWCPVTRTLLSTATLEGSDASIDRVRNDAGYAAGNLAVMSTRANHAKGALGFREARALAQRLADDGNNGGGSAGGLDAAAWARIAALTSFVTPLPHDEAVALPLAVLPPNRLRLFNPVQALQALVCRMLLAEGWAQRASRFEALLPGKPARHAFQMFFHALLPRVIEAAGRSPARSPDAQALRWAVEDAWNNALVRKRWITFARPLGAAGCESLVHRAAARGLTTLVVERHAAAQATEGWNLDSRGYVPHATLMQRQRAGAARKAPAPHGS